MFSIVPAKFGYVLDTSPAFRILLPTFQLPNNLPFHGFSSFILLTLCKIHFFEDKNQQPSHFFEDTFVEILYFFEDNSLYTVLDSKSTPTKNLHKIHFFEDKNQQPSHFFEDTFVEILYFFEDNSLYTVLDSKSTPTKNLHPPIKYPTKIAIFAHNQVSKKNFIRGKQNRDFGYIESTKKLKRQPE